jgi:hypothetical protein
MLPPIILAEGFVDVPDYRGPVSVRIGGIYFVGGSLIVAETNPTDAELRDYPEFQAAVIRMLVEAGRIEPGNYQLMPATDSCEAGNHLFCRLLHDGQDITEAFCLEHGAEDFRELRPYWPTFKHRPRFQYEHRFIVKAPNERLARCRAAAMLPDHEVWSDYGPEYFDLESVNGDEFTLIVKVTLSKEHEEDARELIAELFGPLVNHDIRLHRMTEEEIQREDEENTATDDPG